MSCSNKYTLGAIGPEMCAGPRSARLHARQVPRARPLAVARRESRGYLANLVIPLISGVCYSFWLSQRL
jgi:hypothetical protein